MKFISRYIIISLVMLFFFILSILIPLTGDDWTWKSTRGIARLNNFFDNYNGRYLSNILEIVSVRSTLFRVFLMTTFSTLLIYLISKISYRENNISKLLTPTILVLLLPISVFSQTFGWTAGYVNYVISVVSILFFLLIYRNEFNSELKGTSFFVLKLFGIAILAICSMLFVEHVSLYLLAIGFTLNLFWFYKYKKINILYLVSFVGFVIGAIIMFSNRAYFSVVEGSDSYRTIKGELSTFERAIDIFIYQMNYHFNIQNLVILIIILICLIAVMIIRNKTNIINLVLLSPLLLDIIIVYSNHASLSSYRRGSILYEFTAWLFLLSIVTTVIFIILNIHSYKNSHLIFFYIASSLFLTLPFLVITPYGGRCAFASLIFIVLIIIEFFEYIKSHINLSINKSYCVKALLFVFVSISILFPIYFNKMTEIERDNLVKENNQAKNIILPLIPYPEYHQMPDPKESVYMTQFYKELFDVDDGTEFIFK